MSINQNSKRKPKLPKVLPKHMRKPWQMTPHNHIMYAHFDSEYSCHLPHTNTAPSRHSIAHTNYTASPSGLCAACRVSVWRAFDAVWRSGNVAAHHYQTELRPKCHHLWQLLPDVTLHAPET